MKHFIRGIVVGVGIGMLLAPMKGQEMRRLLGQRFGELRARMPENAQLNEYMQQVGDRVSQTSGNLRDYAQQAVAKVKDTSSSLTGLAKQATSDVKQTGQDVASTTKQAVGTAKQ